jgi:hypothetical protein
VKYFDISSETYKIGFQTHALIVPEGSIIDQLDRRKLFHRRGTDKGNPNELKKIIQQNASLRVEFGWSFESSTHYEAIMEECIDTIFPKYNIAERRPFGTLITDLRCSWLGFVPFDIFDVEIFDNMSIAELIKFNNELIQFQTDVVEFISQHKIFKQHTLLRNEGFRFNYFKRIRKDPDALTDAYMYYMEAIGDACMLTAISRDVLELEIGCHFLGNPDLFSQLLEISILQGNVYE